MRNHIQKLIYTLPQAFFPPENVQQILKRWEFLEERKKTYLKAHPYFAAGAFCPRHVQRIMKYMEISQNHENHEKYIAKSAD